MPKTIAQRELRNDNARVIAEVIAGETFIVTRNGEPVAELRPVVTGPRPRPFVSREDFVAAARRGPHIDAQQWRDDMDAVIDQSTRW